MTIPRRMALAFVCMLLALVTIGVAATLPSVIRFGARYALPMLQMLPVYLMFAMPGWVVALPFVLAFRDAEGWRGGVILLIGTAIGPLVIAAMLLLSIHGPVSWDYVAHHLVQWKADGFAFEMALLIGFLTSGFYVLGLRWATLRRPRTAV